MEDEIYLHLQIPKEANSRRIENWMLLLLAYFKNGPEAVRVKIEPRKMSMVVGTVVGLTEDDEFEDLKRAISICFDEKYLVHLSEQRLGKRYVALAGASPRH